MCRRTHVNLLSVEALVFVGSEVANEFPNEGNSIRVRLFALLTTRISERRGMNLVNNTGNAAMRWIAVGRIGSGRRVLYMPFVRSISPRTLPLSEEDV